MGETTLSSQGMWNINFYSVNDFEPPELELYNIEFSGVCVSVGGRNYHITRTSSIKPTSPVCIHPSSSIVSLVACSSEDTVPG